MCAGIGLFMGCGPTEPSFRDALKARTRNPDACAELVSGFRVRSLHSRPGMTVRKPGWIVSRRNSLLAERDCELHGFDDLHVASAAADIAAERLQDFLIARIGV